MRKLLPTVFLGCLLALASAVTQAETLVAPTLLKATERGLFMSSGRYFVAGKDGVHEIKRTPDYSPNCRQDSSSGYSVCEVVPTRYGTDTCFFTGMTTDHTYLYAACTVWASDSVLSQLKPPRRAALYRIKPGANGAAAEIKIRPFTAPAWYNGMTMLDANTLLMSPSTVLDSSGPAIVKLKINSTSTLDHTISQWLPGSLLYLLPNGISVSNGHVYYVGGQSLFRIQIKPDGSASTPLLVYQVPVNKVLDDMVINGDWIAVAEIGIVNGLGLNSITIIHKTGLTLPYKIPTGMTQVSALAIDPGTFATPGSYIATSQFQGGVYRFFY